MPHAPHSPPRLVRAGTTRAVVALVAAVAAVAALTGALAPPAGAAPQAPRVLIDTDLGGDPDDIQSLVRAVHYSDALSIEGIVTTAGPGTGEAAMVREWIRRTDVDHLRERHPDLMSEAELLAGVKTGTRHTGAPRPGQATAGSRHIITRAHAGSADDPLWLLAWGSLGTIAQALHDDPSIAPKVRIYSIGDYNSRANLAARDFVLDFLDDHPQLWWIENGVWPLESHSTFRGVWRGGNQSGEWDRRAFVERHIRGHGTTAGGEFERGLGDAFPLANSPAEAVGSLKEGDSPSLLYLLSPTIGGIGDLDDPTVASWGGQFRRASSKHPNHYVDLDCNTKEACQATVNRHRVAQLSDWKARWDRYHTDVAEASPAPEGGRDDAPTPARPAVEEPVGRHGAEEPASGGGRPRGEDRGDDVTDGDGAAGPTPRGATVTIADKAIRESAEGRWLSLAAERTDATGSALTVAWRTEDGTATAGEDYVARQGILDFGTTRERVWINIWVIGDRVAEEDEAFTVVLDAPRGGNLATATIEDDDR